ncbi:MAG: tetratricopeptide repeat protein [Planctomycetota bacterium]
MRPTLAKLLIAAACYALCTPAHADEQTLREAAIAVTKQGYARAEPLYRQVLADSSSLDRAQWARATLGMAIVQHFASPTSEERLDSAAELYQQLIETNDISDTVRARAMLNLGRLRELRDYTGEPTDLDEALRLYERVVDQFPHLDAADEAALWRANTAYQRHLEGPELRAAFDELARWASARSEDRHLLSVLHEYLGMAAFNSGMPDLALTHLRRADEIGIADPSFAPRVWWTIANLARDVGDTETAVAFFQKIITESPRSGRAFESQLALHEIIEATGDSSIVVPPVPSPHTEHDPLARPGLEGDS